MLAAFGYEANDSCQLDRVIRSHIVTRALAGESERDSDSYLSFVANAVAQRDTNKENGRDSNDSNEMNRKLKRLEAVLHTQRFPCGWKWQRDVDGVGAHAR